MAVVAAGTAVLETRQQQAPSSARAFRNPTLQPPETCMNKQNLIKVEIDSGNPSGSSKQIKPYSSPYSGDYADTHLKDNLLAKQLLSFLSNNPKLDDILNMLDGIEGNGHAHWAEKSIAMVVGHLVKNHRYDDAKTFIHGITFKDGDFADNYLKVNLINMLPEDVKLERRPEQKHTKLPFDGTTAPNLGITPHPKPTRTGDEDK